MLSTITLGLYEIYWLAATRNEMVSKYRVKIPHAFYMVAVKAFQFFGAIIVLVLIFSIIPSEEKAVKAAFENRPPKPSAECLAEYAQSMECRNEVDSYFDAPKDITPHLYATVSLILITMITSEAFLITRWLLPWARGVNKVTGGWSRRTTMAVTLPGVLLPTSLTPLYYILIIQHAFNRIR